MKEAGWLDSPQGQRPSRPRSLRSDQPERSGNRGRTLHGHGPRSTHRDLCRGRAARCAPVRSRGRLAHRPRNRSGMPRAAAGRAASSAVTMRLPAATSWKRLGRRVPAHSCPGAERNEGFIRCASPVSATGSGSAPAPSGPVERPHRGRWSTPFSSGSTNSTGHAPTGEPAAHESHSGMTWRITGFPAPASTTAGIRTRAVPYVPADQVPDLSPVPYLMPSSGFSAKWIGTKGKPMLKARARGRAAIFPSIMTRASTRRNRRDPPAPDGPPGMRFG